MSFTLIASIVSFANQCWTLFKNCFGGSTSAPAKDENTQAVEVANQAGKLSADEARTTRETTDKEIASNDAATTSDLAAVRSAGSLLDGQAAVDSAIARANSHLGANS